MTAGVAFEFEKDNKWTKLIVPVEYKFKNVTSGRHYSAGYREFLGNSFSGQYLEATVTPLNFYDQDTGKEYEANDLLIKL